MLDTRIMAVTFRAEGVGIKQRARHAQLKLETFVVYTPKKERKISTAGESLKVYTAPPKMKNERPKQIEHQVLA